MSTEEEITAAINAKGEEIRVLKAAKPATLKDDLAPLIADLLALKVSFKSVTGEDFGGPKPEEKKKAVQVEKKSDGPSKTELNKLKRKADKAEKRAEAKGEEVVAEAASAAETAAAPQVIHLLVKIFEGNLQRVLF
jgi:hypothetical protein